MITSYVRVNEIGMYENYKEFIERYLLQLAEDTTEATGMYNAYYECFIANMYEDIKKLQSKYDKTEEDIYIAYEIKTLWQFYVGFLNEKVLTYYMDNYSCYGVAERTVEEKIYIDNNYAIDVELVNDEGDIKAIQCKSYTYLRLSEEKKKVHINKHAKYKSDYENSNTYYVLHQENKPCYYMKDNEPCYLIESKDILAIKQSDISIGSYEDMMKQMKGDI